MACNGDLYGLIDCLQSGCCIAIKTISICQVSKDTSFVF